MYAQDRLGFAVRTGVPGNLFPFPACSTSGIIASHVIPIRYRSREEMLLLLIINLIKDLLHYFLFIFFFECAQVIYRSVLV